MEDLKSIFIHNLKKARVRTKMTQAQLAEETELSVGFIGDIETGRTSPSFQNIEIIAQALKVEPFMLFIPIENRKILDSTQVTLLLDEIEALLHKYSK